MAAVRSLFVIALFFAVSPAVAQENCFDGLDNDGDGFIDLNDPDGCDCEVQDNELISNGDFEEFSQCPNSFSQFGVVNDFYPPSGGSTDYNNTCGFNGNTALYPPVPDYPSGEGCASFYSDSQGYREYIGQCLSQPLEPGITYTLSFDLAGAVEFMDNSAFISASDFLPFGLFGTTICPNYVGDNNYLTCLEEAGDYTSLVEDDLDVEVNGWNSYSYTFTVPETFTGIAIGPGCDSPPGNETSYYFYLDNLSIQAEVEDVETPSFTVNGNSCTGFELVAEEGGFEDYQWYVNGVAVADGNGLVFTIPPDSIPEVTLGATTVNSSLETVCTFAPPVQLEESSIEVSADYEETLCEDETTEVILAIEPEGTYEYQWSTGEETESIEVGTGEYSVEVTNVETGCTEELEIVIEECVSDLSVQLADVDICEGEQATLEAIVSGGLPPFSFQWTPVAGDSESISVSPAETTSYAVSITDAQGAVATAMAEVTVSQSFEFQFDLGEDQEICQGEEVVLGGDYPEDLTYAWNTGATTPQIAVSDPGTYVLRVFNACGEIADTVELSLAPGAVIPFFNRQVSFCRGESVTIGLPSSADYDVLWSGGMDSSRITVREPGTYTAQFSSQCLNQEINVEVNSVDCACNIYAPNAFTPNGDGLNDVFRIVSECSFDEYELRIFNRWGEIVFESDNPDRVWKGEAKGGEYFSPVSSYVWILRVDPTDDLRIIDPFEVTGTISLIR